MRTLAYCAESYREATRRAAGVEPMTCPPAWWKTLRLDDLEQRDLLYLDLHGERGSGCWCGDGGLIALTAEQVERADLGGAVVFATSCYLEDGTPMLTAFLAAGARCVIGGGGPNYGGRRSALGAQLLGLWLRRGMQWGLGVERALDVARRRLALAAMVAALRRAQGASRAARDALGFRVYWGARGRGARFARCKWANG